VLTTGITLAEGGFVGLLGVGAAADVGAAEGSVKSLCGELALSIALVEATPLFLAILAFCPQAVRLKAATKNTAFTFRRL